MGVGLHQFNPEHAALQDVAIAAEAFVEWLQSPGSGDPNAYALLIARIHRWRSLETTRDDKPAQWGCWTIDAIQRAEEAIAEKRCKAPSRERGLMREGWIYLLRNPEGHYKIGRTINITRRLFELTSGAPAAFQLIHLIWADDTLIPERILHRRFANKRSSRECFELDSDDVTWLCSFDHWADCPEGKE
jgi:predicted GIY-YIG superfamily endonuclease